MNMPIIKPIKRYAIRALIKGKELWLTDDGEGCDESCEMTGWHSKNLMSFVEREEAQCHANHMKQYAKERGMRLRVLVVKEYPGGFFER